MQSSTPLDYLPLWLGIWVIVIFLLLLIEAGYRLGRYRRQRAADEMETPVGAIVGATLGLLGFILAFTFSLAASRFDARRQMVVEEANAIGTTYLRAGLLPDQVAGMRVRNLLEKYVELRLQTVATGNIELALNPAEELQQELWQTAETVGRTHPDSIVVGLFLESLNETIDVHSKRVLVGLRNRLPTSLWAALFVITSLTMLGVGYHEGLTKSRRSPAILVLVLSFCMVLKLIADLDRPLEGDLQVSQEAMVELREMIHQAQAEDGYQPPSAG
jgi:hypothetical protein